MWFARVLQQFNVMLRYGSSSVTRRKWWERRRGWRRCSKALQSLTAKMCHLEFIWMVFLQCAVPFKDFRGTFCYSRIRTEWFSGKALRWDQKKKRPMCPGKKCNYTELIVLLLSFSVLLKQQVCVFSLMLGSDGKKKKENPLKLPLKLVVGEIHHFFCLFCYPTFL